MQPVKDKSIKEMHDGLCREVFSLKEDQRAIDGFKLMIEKRVSGIALVDGSGTLVDTLSGAFNCAGYVSELIACAQCVISAALAPMPASFDASSST